MAKTAVKPAGGLHRKMAKRKMTLALLSMMLPGFIYLIINNYIPMAGLVIAFKRFDYSKGIWGSDWCGLSNFTYLFKTQDALNIIRNTVCYNLVFILLGNLLAVAVAVMLNFLRGRMNNSALYEAATVDGAGRWRQVWHVTLPGLKGTIITMVLLNIGRMFYTDFGLFYQVPMRSGLISSVTDTIDVFVYKGLTQLNDIGRASAAGFLQSVLGFILVLTVNFIVRKVDEENALF